MKKGINIVVLGVLTVVSVILALPFTPLRNSFKGVATNAADKALTSLGVDLNGKIRNARMIAKSHEYEAYSFNINDMNAKSKYSRSGLYAGLNGMHSDGSYNLSDEKEAAHANSGMPGDLSTSSGSGRNNLSKMGGFVSVSSRLTSENASSSTGGTTKQNANTDNNGSGGATHPGGDPNALPSLPLNNGFLCLLSFALVYVSIKNGIRF
ncbi:MAG: hypothetical protein WCG08_05775 [Paludibacter sp.]|jgi:hypothetical protein